MDFTLSLSAAQQAVFEGPFNLGIVEVAEIHLTHTPLGLTIKTTYVPLSQSRADMYLVEDGKANIGFAHEYYDVITLPDGRTATVQGEVFTTGAQMPATIDLFYVDSQQLLRLDTKTNTASLVLLTPESQEALFEGI